MINKLSLPDEKMDNNNPGTGNSAFQIFAYRNTIIPPALANLINFEDHQGCTKFFLMRGLLFRGRIKVWSRQRDKSFKK